MQDQNRQRVKQAWLQAGLYGLSDSKLQSFLQHFERTLHGCWPDLWPLVRESYAEYKEQLLTPIWDTGEKMLRLGVILALAPDHTDEVQLFRRLAQRPNMSGNPWELDALMRVARRRGLSTEEHSL
jgi:hypothetical protein